MAFTKTGKIKEDLIFGGGLFCVFVGEDLQIQVKVLNRQMDTQ